MDHAFDAVFTVDEKGRICTVNKAALKLFEYEENEMIGKNVSLICGGGHAEHHDEYMHNYLVTGIKKMIGTKRETMARKKDGSEFPCELGIDEIVEAGSGKRYFCGFIKDMSQLKQHENEIQERRALAEGMINASFEPMIEIDQTGIIKIVNDACCSLFGYKREELVGSNISIICGGGHASNHDGYLQKYMDTGVRHVIGRKRHVQAKRKDGSEIEVELGVQEVKLNNGKRAFCGFIRDLTQKNKDKKTMKQQAELIHGKFFNGTETDEGT